MANEQYAILPSGYYQRLSDGSGPYVKDGDDYTLANAGGGSSNGVTEERVEEIVDDKISQIPAPPQPPTTAQLQQTTRTTPLTGFSVKEWSSITRADTVLAAFEKLQGGYEQLKQKIEDMERANETE